MTMHDKIMALEPIGCKSQVSALQFTNAKMRASQIAHEGDKIISSLAAALSHCKDHLEVNSSPEEVEYAQSILDEYRRWRNGE